MVPQVPTIGILMIVNGTLTILVGLLYAAMGPLMFSIMKIGGQQGGVNQGDEGILTVLSVVYLVLGLVVFASGVLSVFGGVRALRYRGRTLVLVALFANLIPMLTCYCAPTSMGLMIYGLIVLFNADVVRAFELGDQGISRDEIAYRFSGRSYRGDRDDDRNDTDDSWQPQSPIRPDPKPPDEGQFRT